ncbi:3-hydroxyacyl-CoA dehydrogenase family protein [Shigella flexneri]
MLLLETTGETALALGVASTAPVVVSDHLRGGYGRLGLLAPTLPRSRPSTQSRLPLSAAGQKSAGYCRLSGLLVWRMVAMVNNEALDALQKGVASEQDIDTAMRPGGELSAWPTGVGSATRRAGDARLLENLQQHDGEEALSPRFMLRHGR